MTRIPVRTVHREPLRASSNGNNGSTNGGLYVSAKTLLMAGVIRLGTDAVRWVLVEVGESAYTPDLERHMTLADIPANARKAVSEPLLGVKVTNGTATAEMVRAKPAKGERFDGMVLTIETPNNAEPFLLTFGTFENAPVTADGESYPLSQDPLFALL